MLLTKFMMAPAVFPAATGFDSLVEFINNYKTPMMIVLNSLIGLIALVFIGIQIVKMISEIRGKKWNEAGKSFAVIAAIVVVAGLGIVGVVKLGKVFTPTGADNGNFNVGAPYSITQPYMIES